jgi:hypothetical protein
MFEETGAVNVFFRQTAGGGAHFPSRNNRDLRHFIPSRNNRGSIPHLHMKFQFPIFLLIIN